MAQSSANQSEDEFQRCAWLGCHGREFEYTELCFEHASRVAARMHVLTRQTVEMNLDRKKHRERHNPKPLRQSFVYYLMIGPSTVKIGTTTDLKMRLRPLRTDPQYVVAIERGGRNIEAQRHEQFAQERIGKREDFQLSDRLKEHIEALLPERNELIALALAN